MDWENDGYPSALQHEPQEPASAIVESTGGIPKPSAYGYDVNKEMERPARLHVAKYTSLDKVLSRREWKGSSVRRMTITDNDPYDVFDPRAKDRNGNLKTVQSLCMEPETFEVDVIEHPSGCMAALRVIHHAELIEVRYRAWLDRRIAVAAKAKG